jgi:uncharacterized membrane protein YedE/YeeE
MGIYLQALLGGVLIGVASWALFAGLGRISGISSITSDAVVSPVSGAAWRWTFLLGLVGGGALFTSLLGVQGVAPRSAWLLVPAGLLVGFGTVLGSGCTSGHGVCGLGRRSLRSLVAVLTFMATGMVTVTLVSLGAH